MRKPGTACYRKLQAIVICTVHLFLISAVVGGQASMPAGTGGDTSIHLRAEATGPGKPLVHFWSKVVGAGRAKEGLETTWQEELATAAKDGGFHGISHENAHIQMFTLIASRSVTGTRRRSAQGDVKCSL
jgi:hypothetical protein